MEILDAVILGVVEGITEFLPISSTAHMILVAKLLDIPESDFLRSFEIIIQMGAIFAVLTIYFRKFLEAKVLKNVIVGFLPTAILGLVFYKSIKMYLGNIYIVLWALLVGGIIMIIFEKRRSLFGFKESSQDAGKEEMTTRDCVKVGIFQAIAFIPGVSRSAATILGGLSLGISRVVIVEYSFLLAVPTMLAATGLDAIKNIDLITHSGNISALMVGLAVSYAVALFAIKGFLSYVRKNSFIPFGIYRIALALLFFLFI